MSLPKTMEKIKVVRIITRLNIGGPATHAVILTEGLDKEKFKSFLVIGKVDKNEGDMIYLAREKKIEPDIKIVSSMMRPLSLVNDFKAFVNLFLLLKKNKPHIVHTHTAKAGFLGRLAAILAGVPIRVHSFHGHVFHSYFNTVETRIFILIEKIFARFTDKIIVVSDSIKADVCDRFKITDKSKAAVVKLGLDLDKFNNVDQVRGVFRKTLNIPKETLLVGIVGRLVAVKNHKFLLDAIKILKDQASTFSKFNVKFLIIGDGELRPMLENYAVGINIKDMISFVGWHKDMASVYADLDIVALTSLNEGTPLSLIEAMASRRPIIATAVGGVLDLIIDGKTGILVAGSDVKKFAKGLNDLIINDKLRAELGNNAVEFVNKNFSKKRLVNDIEILYRELMMKKGV